MAVLGRLAQRLERMLHTHEVTGSNPVPPTTVGPGPILSPQLDPIMHGYDLRCSAQRAFDIYVKRISDWWDPRYTANADTLKLVTIEPRVGGRIYATHTDLGDLEWGRVTVWEPGRRLVYTSTLAQTPEHPSIVSVSFIPNGTLCTMKFEHGGWNEHNASDRKKFSDWPVMLNRFAALANTSEA